MRRSFDGLFAMVEQVINEDPLSGHLFLFRNRNRDRIKIMWWDQDGLVIYYKRLEEGCFQLPTDGQNESDSVRRSCEIRADELTMLLSGIDLTSIKRRKRYRRSVV
jgi:transposase